MAEGGSEQHSKAKIKIEYVPKLIRIQRYKSEISKCRFWGQTSHRQRHRGVYRVAPQLEMCGHLKLTQFGSYTS